MSYNIVLLEDFTEEVFLSKTLGVYKVAAALRQAGYEVTVVSHLHTFSLVQIREILQHLINSQTLFVGVSSFFYKNTGNIQPANNHAWEQGGVKFDIKQRGAFLPHGIEYNTDIRNLIKTCNPQCAVVLGGPDAQDLSYIRDYDYVVIGYGDTAVVNLANHLAHGEPLQHQRRSVFGPTVIDDRRAEGYAFTTTPMTYSAQDSILPGETLVTEISRGCVFRCAFCAYPLNGKKRMDHIKLEHLLYREFLDNYEKFGVTRYLFSDDTFNDSVEKVEMIHRISQRLPFQLEYWAYIRLDLLAAHPETADMLFDSGLRAAHFGIETMCPDAARVIGKGGSRQRLIDMLHYCKQHWGNRVSLYGTFIFGLPHESVDSMQHTAQQLLDRVIPLDSWAIFPLAISVNNLSYTSDIDRRPEHYGYQLGQIDTSSINFQCYDWSNNLTNYQECKNLAEQTVQRGIESGQRLLPGLSLLQIVGMGLNIDDLINRPIKDINWHQISQIKHQRAQEYQRLLYRNIGLVDKAEKNL